MLNAYPLTVTAWIRTTDNSATAHGIVNKYLDASGNGYSVHLASGGVRAWFFAGSGGSIIGSGGLNGGLVADGQWHHVAFTVDASGGRLYVDGAPKDSFGWSGTPSAPTSAEPLRIGRYPGGSNFTGDIDEVAVWNAARTPAQIADAMNAPLSGLETGLAGYWRFDETNGPTARDAGTGFRDGAWNGGVVSIPSGVGTTRLPLGSTLALDGGGYVQVPHATALDSFPLTVAAWVRTTNTDASVRGIVNKYLDASGNGYSAGCRRT